MTLIEGGTDQRAKSHISLLHRLWRIFPARQRRLLLARATALLAPAIDRLPPPATAGLAVLGELSRATGIGETGRQMLQALRRLDIPNWSMDISTYLPGMTASIPVSQDSHPPAGVPLVFHVNSPTFPAVLFRLPRSLIAGRRIIGYWAWELPVVPKEWQIGVPFVHEVWVPSHFAAAALEAIVPGRVRVVPPSLALTTQQPQPFDRAALDVPQDALIVLTSFNLASSFERKNPLAAIAAFQAAFGHRQDRVLIVKVGNPGHFPKDFSRLTSAVAGAPNIRLETRVFSTEDNYAITAAADVMLSLHRAEAFGLTLAEAMLLGKPVIATAWSGNMEYMNSESAALVDYKLTPIHDPRHVYDLSGAQWAEPDHNHAVAQLLRLADAEERCKLGTHAKKFATERLGERPLYDALLGIGLGLLLAQGSSPKTLATNV